MSAGKLLTLMEVPVGHRARVRRLHTEPDVGSRLRELGLHENALIRCITKGNGVIICEVCNTRIGLNKTLAGTIVVSIFES